MFCRRALALTALLLLPAAAAHAVGPDTLTRHGIAMHGDLKYGPAFKHFDYANPEAPKGGKVNLGVLATSFDTFNGFIVKGVAAAGIGQIYDTLMTPAADEPFSEYGLLAETVTTPPDRSWVEFTLRPQARWHDGQPVTVDDVIWTFDTLRSKGHPYFKAYYAAVDKVEKTADRAVRFTFKPGENRELPLIVGQLSVLPKHYWASRDFEQTTLEPPLGSGPYKIKSFDAGRRITYERVADYWGKDLPVNVGRNNFDLMQYDYYRDDTVLIEAFKANEYDFRLENSSKHWATAYEIEAVGAGVLKKEAIPNDRPAGMQGYAYNVRRPLFKDSRVRRALAYAFDFEWTNKTLFYGAYTRNRSYFDNSELAATGVPTGAELELLQPYRGKIPEEVFTQEYNPPSTDGSGKIRDNLRRAIELLAEAGWKVDKTTRKLTAADTGEVMAFEILLHEPLFERVTLPFVKNLERLGIAASVRTVDTAQYQQRVDHFDFDMVVNRVPQSSSPGNEQRLYWGSQFAQQPGSHNVIGIADPIIDALIEAIIAAPDRASLVNRTHALDRVLQWGHWMLPHWYIANDRILYWDKFGRPAVTPSLGVQFDAWWVDPEKAATLERRKKELRLGQKG
jgi:microcin C transport system substrate-binding protein